jgi:hypothetical protein
MEMKEKISSVMHTVGNKVSLAGVFYAGHGPKEWTGENLEEVRGEAIKNFEGWINEKNVKDEDIVNFLSKLKNSNWSTKESFNSFRSEIFEPYVKPLLNEQEEIQKQFGRNKLK